MKRRIFSLVGLAAAVAVAGGVVSVSGAPSAQEQPTVYRAPAKVGAVYKLSVRAVVDGRVSENTEWVAPSSGAWRLEAGEFVYVHFGPFYFVRDTIEGLAYLRSGSPSFLGSLRKMSLGAEPLRAYISGRKLNIPGARLRVGRSARGKTELHVTRSGREVVRVRIEQRVTQAEAQRLKLFEITSDSLKNTEREVGPGQAPTLPVQAYWFGPQVDGASAVTSMERRKELLPKERAQGLPAHSEVTAYITLYVPPSAGGKSSAIPGQIGPEGEVKVVSQPVDSAHAQRAIEALNGKNGELSYPPFKRFDVTLANGEQAVVIPDQFEGTRAVRTGFYVITDTTFVYVSGSFSEQGISQLASALRPV